MSLYHYLMMPCLNQDCGVGCIYHRLKLRFLKLPTHCKHFYFVTDNASKLKLAWARFVAQLVAMTPRNIISKLHSTGSGPFNPIIFLKFKIAPAPILSSLVEPQALQIQPPTTDIQPSTDMTKENLAASTSTI